MDILNNFQDFLPEAEDNGKRHPDKTNITFPSLILSLM